jgi:hypothetical protein
LQSTALHIYALDLATFGVIHKLGIRDLILCAWFIKLLKDSKQNQANDQPNTHFLEQIVIQITPLPD